MKEKEWTVMVYLAGDNNLSENMIYSLNDLANIGVANGSGKRSNVNLLAFFDGNSLTAPTYYFDYSEEKAYKHPIEKDDIYHTSGRAPIPAKTKAFDNDGDSSSAYSIMNFVRWCIETRRRKAKNYAIIFSGHSFGFHGTSFLRDEGTGGFITLFEFRQALEKIIEYYTKEKIAILGFDSCVMSMLEVGYELKDTAQVFVASEGSLPNAGWGYAPMLKEFMASNSETLNLSLKQKSQNYSTKDYIKESAKAFVKAFTEHQKELALGGRSVDIAAWDMEKIEPIAEGVAALAQTINNRLDLTDKIDKNELTDQDIAVYQELKKILLQSHFDTQTYMKEQCVDLKDFCQRLIVECKFLEEDKRNPVFTELIEKCKNIVLAVDKCVLSCGYCGDEYQFSNGISLYFPWTALTYFLTDYRYRYLFFNRGKGNYNLKNPTGIGKEWNKFLFNYLSRVTLRAARKTIDGQVSPFENFSKDNPVWSKDNPPWSKDNQLWSKDNPPWSKDNPPWSKDNPPWSKDNPRWSKGEIGEYLFYFSRFKNFQLAWDIFGYADEATFDENFQ
jgi:hypothetical protein